MNRPEDPWSAEEMTMLHELTIALVFLGLVMAPCVAGLTAKDTQEG